MENTKIWYFDNFYFSQYTRKLEYGSTIIIGNIIVDGRWIEIKKHQYDEVISCMGMKKIVPEKITPIINALYVIKAIYPIEYTENQINIKEVFLELTTNCNLQCKHCSGSFGNNNNQDSELDYNTLLQMIKCFNILNINQITLTGGEPFLHSRIYDILKVLKQEFHGEVNIITNGTLIDQSQLELIVSSIKRFNISLDGYDEESVSFIRGKNVFNRVMKTIELLKGIGYEKISLSCVDTNDKEKIERFHILAKNLSVYPIVRHLNIKGRAKENFAIEHTLRKNHNLTKKGLNFKCLCNHENNTIFISHRGSIHPCAALREKEISIGQFQPDDFSLHMQRATPIVDIVESCKNCNIRYFCASVCVSENNEIYTNDEILQNYCAYKKAEIKKIIWG